jgi:hypothetical protein
MSKIQAALNAAMRDIAGKGIGKTQKNEQQGYRFRGVEQAMNELSPIMVNHGITVRARYSEMVITERAKAEGKATRFCTLKGVFTFAAEDDSSVEQEAYGEAMDSGDKALIKAQSVAFRTALFQLFVVPTMSMDTELYGDDDGDGEQPREEQPRPELTPKSATAWKHAKAAFLRDGNLVAVLKHATISEANQTKLMAEAEADAKKAAA